MLTLLNLNAEPLDQWFRRNPLPEANRLNSATYGTNTFVAVGAGGAIVSSGDGTNWVSQISGTSEDLRGVAYGNGTFVAVGGFGEIFASVGSNWTNVGSESTALLHGITYGGGIFVAVGDVNDFGNASVLTSSDGLTWTLGSAGMPGSLSGTYASGMFVAVGEDAQSSLRPMP